MKTLGSCFCGTVEFSISGEIPEPLDCYCTNCSKLHGAAFATHTVVRTENFEWLKGFESVKSFESSKDNFRHFCGKCGSQLIVFNHNYPGITVVVYAALDSKNVPSVTAKLFTSRKPSWLNDKAVQYDESVTEEEWDRYVEKWHLS